MKAIPKRADTVKRLREAAKLLDRANHSATAMTLDGEDPINWAFAVGATKSILWSLLADFGDSSLRDAWDARLKAEREARGTSQLGTDHGS